MKSKITSILVTCMLVFGFGVAITHAEEKNADQAQKAGTKLEVQLLDNGKVLVRGAKVTSVSQNSVNASTAWGSIVLNWTVNTDGDTEFLRRFEGRSSLAEISVGDIVSFQGSFATNATSLTVNARVVKDWSIQKRRASFYGIVQSVDTANQSFVLKSEERGNVTVAVSSSTEIRKGESTGTFTFNDITVNAKVSARGLWNTVTNRLEADYVKIHSQNATRTTIEGSVRSVVGVTAPTTMVIIVDNKDYVVNIAIDTSILNASWLRASLSSLRAGDKVRVYGTVNPNNTIDATVIRDVSLR